MDIKKILAEFKEWLAKQEITDVEIAENAGEDGDITTVFFPIPQDEGYLSYEICAAFKGEDPLYLMVDYCDIPDVDELELYRFLNEINATSLLTATVDEGSLVFSYSLPLCYINCGQDLVNAFFAVWDAVDALRDDISEAFGLADGEAE